MLYISAEAFMKWFLLLSLSFTTSAYALSFQISYKGNVLFSQNHYDIDLQEHLGIPTLELLNQSGLDFEGGSYGVKSISGLGNKIESVSSTEMKAYGWCFSIDSQVPETMIDETFASTQDSQLRWFYAYAHFKNGQWIAQCQEDL
ncbi:MAG: hypothetical protein COW00_19095 [Bdellovibrio sp. CG12_big_fil_rev_8_21_14_0_65_39_13]|nr:MAG: hypothetical protein COW78_17180 [Bdellovibrio sp. CG22_combo_CG10-13_8_21_14_all_39_27]PIQ57804.1 MAG: hypothetical protein COW00_19095 [Bdellovibrio sp. CG12_big_fil_rev_8_21_14_0_65_39_13]PIR34678.1 MAG: hypothetical protein COV37_12145 [Bdellovibrio sp. CG11_big_fil_rev_8_21_14_0_20_39_38]PJB53770.1 MAG: hypothetical protein CO099_05310 [Bdellovibrio sp. CG_4_9_14_3_um_filter_39_7]